MFRVACALGGASFPPVLLLLRYLPFEQSKKPLDPGGRDVHACFLYPTGARVSSAGCNMVSLSMVGCRGMRARRLFLEMLHQHLAAIRIQAAVRGHTQRQRYLHTLAAVVTLQMGLRRWQVSWRLAKGLTGFVQTFLHTGSGRRHGSHHTALRILSGCARMLIAVESMAAVDSQGTARECQGSEAC